jgi:hypothetical protein
MPEEQKKSYTLEKAPKILSGSNTRHGAEVDGIQLWPGGKAVELTSDQVQRLNDVGVKVVEESNTNTGSSR